jgi:adenylate kinase family enzyme
LFVGRQEGLQELKRRLGIGAEEPVAASHMQHITVVFGVPGVGKTTLAAALAYDPNVRQAFPDGILWTSLGEKPALLSVLSRCGDSFRDEGKRLVAANTLTAAVDELTNLLKEKRMLLIVDDVWETEPAATFKRVRGPGCTLVMTTRDREVASDLADRSAKEQVYRLSPLTDENGLQLLRELARSVVDRYREKCLELVRALEGLPLALQVAGRLLHAEAEKERGLVEKLLDELRTGKKLLEARAPADRMDLERQTIPTVAVLLKHSIDRLDKTTRNHFALLGTGPRPAIFSTPTLRNLWRVRDPQPTIDVLIKRGLLEPLGDGRYQMHALLVALADSLLTDE